ncbi:MAG: hypothetical protein DHS20C18_05050 [Saprospiraceae bacterium]|nr:MAG: hypothetical protein DHS20C18_05050 [Saprospiraceae bacterium]
MIALLFSVAAFAQPANDDCSGAIAINCGDIVSSTNVGSTTDLVPSCGLFPSSTGVWYSIVGTGGDITASTCNPNTRFDTQLGVFSGSCASLSCVASNNNSFGCENNRFSTVTFASEVDVTYYILVNGTVDSQGDFELSISCTAAPILNDLCAGAFDIACGGTATGTTTGATNADAPAGTCGTSLASAPGVWYHFVGTGGTITASLCGSSFDTKIGVFSGACGALSCVGGNDDNCGLQSQVSFSSTSGTDYYIYVTAFGTNNGDYTLSVTCASAVTNDACADAIAVNCGDLVSGSTTGATSDAVGTCTTDLSAGPGVWYSVVGTGADITVSTCNAGTDFDTKMGVFSGSCGSLVCVGGNDDSPDPGCQLPPNNFNRFSKVTFASTEGTTYYILVTGFLSAAGNFELSIDCVDPPMVDPTCENATPVECGGAYVGSTTNGLVNDLSNCNGVRLNTARGVWYVLEGNNSFVTVSTCGENTDFDTRLGVFSGDCGALTCVAANDNSNIPGCLYNGRASEVSFPAFAGTTYYIYVTGSFNATGNFDLNLECSLINDNCDGALPVACGESVSGTTTGGTPDNVSFCGTTLSTAEGVWYTVVGTGFDITASLCGSSYDTKMGVFSGACGALSCVDGNDDFCGLQSQVTFTSNDGETYYILVTGFSTSDGNFNLSVTCEADPIDLTCGYLEVFCDDVITGSTAGAPSSPGLGTCGTDLSTAGGVWHAFLGTGDQITVSTCNAGTDYDTKMGVFTGSCDNMLCVAGNDDSTDPGCQLGTLNRFSKVSFPSVEGQYYYIYVTGFLANTGNYELSISCQDSGGSDDCGFPEILCGESVTGSTVGLGTGDAPATCTTTLNSSGGTWYSFQGIGDQVTVTTCNPGTDYDTKMGVFTGTCNGMICVAGNDDGSPSGANPDAACVIPSTGSTLNRASTVTFTALAGQYYYIYVTGFDVNEGNYELSIDCGVLRDGGYEGTTLNVAQNNSIDVKEFEVSDFYPNPTPNGNTKIQIQAPSDATASITLFDQLGRQVYVNSQAEIFAGHNVVEMQFGNLPGGTYFANIRINDQNFRKKVIVANN